MKKKNSGPKMELNLSERSAEPKLSTEKLAGISQKLIGLWDIMAIWAKLQPGESLVLSADGSMHKGRVKTEKLTHLKESFVGKSDGDFDGRGSQQYFITKSWAHAPSPAFKNAWELAAKKSPEINNPAILYLFLEKLEFYHEENSGDTSKLKFSSTQDSYGYYEWTIVIPDFPISCTVNSYGRLVRYSYEGKIYEV